MAKHRAPDDYTSPVPASPFHAGRHHPYPGGPAPYCAPNRRPLQTRRSPLRVLAIAAALAFGGLLTSACGSGGDGPSQGRDYPESYVIKNVQVITVTRSNGAKMECVTIGSYQGGISCNWGAR